MLLDRSEGQRETGREELRERGRRQGWCPQCLITTAKGQAVGLDGDLMSKIGLDRRQRLDKIIFEEAMRGGRENTDVYRLADRQKVSVSPA